MREQYNVNVVTAVPDTYHSNQLKSLLHPFATPCKVCEIQIPETCTCSVYLMTFLPGNINKRGARIK